MLPPDVPDVFPLGAVKPTQETIATLINTIATTARVRAKGVQVAEERRPIPIHTIAIKRRAAKASCEAGALRPFGPRKFGKLPGTAAGRAVTDTVNIVGVPVPLALIEGGLNVQLTPAGRPGQPKLTLPLALFVVLTVIVKAAEDPTWIVPAVLGVTVAMRVPTVREAV